ncbi:hypothetical protein SSS_05610 [Sarcoptes scabiei]|nr:hypothetical protein SSS_05610 [Sarcoptes scabiei]
MLILIVTFVFERRLALPLQNESDRENDLESWRKWIFDYGRNLNKDISNLLHKSISSFNEQINQFVAKIPSVNRGLRPKSNSISNTILPASVSPPVKQIAEALSNLTKRISSTDN